MSTVMKELKAEIARVARRVVRKEVAALQRSNAAHRGFIADLRRQILNLQKEIKAQARGPAASELPVAGNAAAAKRFWITGKGIRALRKRFGMTQTEFAKLCAVSIPAVVIWEATKGKVPVRRHATVARLQQVRQLTKRTARQALGA